MSEGERLIFAAERCTTCGGSGWTWWCADAAHYQQGKWVVCRACLGTGRNDQEGHRLEMPSGVPAEQPDASEAPGAHPRPPDQPDA